MANSATLVNKFSPFPIFCFLNYHDKDKIIQWPFSASFTVLFFLKFFMYLDGLNVKGVNLGVLPIVSNVY